MSPNERPIASSAVAVCWAARLLGLAVLGLYAVIIAGEGLPDPRRLTASEASQMALFLAACGGLVLAWRREVAGGLVTLAAVTLFYANELRLAGRLPRGWAFAILVVPALLSLLAASLSNARRHVAASLENRA